MNEWNIFIVKWFLKWLYIEMVITLWLNLLNHTYVTDCKMITGFQFYDFYNDYYVIAGLYVYMFKQLL